MQQYVVIETGMWNQPVAINGPMTFDEAQAYMVSDDRIPHTPCYMAPLVPHPSRRHEA